MTRREQEIEATLMEFFRREGFAVWQDGDVFAKRRTVFFDPPGDPINVSKLAREVERAI